MIIWQHSLWMIISEDVILLLLLLVALYLSLAFGPEVFAQFLEGCSRGRQAVQRMQNVMKNPAMLDALIGVYERNILGYPSYSSASVFSGTEPFPGTFTAVGYGIQW